MTPTDKARFYKWATASDATPYWYGPMYGDCPPSREKFLSSWKSYYFDGSKPELGRCFLILVDGEPIGQINYNPINQKHHSTEIDLIIADSENWGKGYGSDAVRTLTAWLFENKGLDVREVWVAPIKSNPRAILAYMKAGFEIVDPPPCYFKPPIKGTTKANDWLVLIRKR